MNVFAALLFNLSAEEVVESHPSAKAALGWGTHRSICCNLSAPDSCGVLPAASSSLLNQRSVAVARLFVRSQHHGGGDAVSGLQIQ
jgi:hypothetical protein